MYTDSVIRIVSAIVQPATYCEMYPVTVYALEVEGPTSHSVAVQLPSNSALAVNNLLDNQAYVKVLP